LCTCLLIGSFAGFGLAGFTVPTGALDTTRLLGFLCLLGALPLVLAVATHESRVATQRQLRSATIDPITGLNNRTAFEQQVRGMLAAAHAPPRALAYVDLDHLKLVNDTSSHAAGDALIHGIAGVLQASLRPGDVVGHFGGDEFGLLLHNCLPAAAEDRAREALRAIECYRCQWQGRALGTTASIGLVPFQGAQDFARLLSQADAACFAAKEQGGNHVCRVALDGGDRRDPTQAMRWAVRVREAVENHGLLLYGQAIAPLHGEPGGRHFELLLRMRDPLSGELLLPGQFFPAADRYRLGVRIDREVIEIALGWLERHADPADIDMCCINLTAEALVDEGFIAFLGERLRRSGFPPDKLCLEIAETSALRDIARAQRFIGQMRSRGCRFALDDFGTGFCSFGYLRSLDVDYFKIDGSFVREMHESPLSLQIVRAITDIAHVLDKQSIAEHAETLEQLALLTELGVDMAQGYAVHRPEPIEAYLARTLAPAALPRAS
jgi:diguanylate cyclase (GGDEF)-like protein